MKEQKRLRAIKDCNDILQEEYDNSNLYFKTTLSLGLEKLKFLQSNGRLVLTENNIEKITAYLNIDKFLNAISARKELTPEQIKGE